MTLCSFAPLWSRIWDQRLGDLRLENGFGVGDSVDIDDGRGVPPRQAPPGPHSVIVVAPPGATLGAALSAALQARGWSPVRLSPLSALPHLGHAPTVLIVEDDQGRMPEVVPLRWTTTTCVCVGSVRALSLLIRLSERGSTVLNQSAPILVLVQLVEEALRARYPAGCPGAGTKAQLRQRESEQAALSALTPLESEVLQALVQGHAAAQIAQRTHRSVHTVRSHIKAVLAKLGVMSQVAAIALANRSGVFQATELDRARFTNFGDDAWNDPARR